MYYIELLSKKNGRVLIPANMVSFVSRPNNTVKVKLNNKSTVHHIPMPYEDVMNMVLSSQGIVSFPVFDLD